MATYLDMNSPRELLSPAYLMAQAAVARELVCHTRDPELIAVLSRLASAYDGRALPAQRQLDVRTAV